MGNDPDMTALALAKNKLTMASFSRQQEFEADSIGVGISARAHFDPYGASRFLTAMERNAELKAGKATGDPRAQDFLSSHPATPERVQSAQASARQYASPENGERDRETYLAAIDNLVYGEDPSEGFVRGHRFLHPKLGFTFSAPDTFTLDNTAQAVIGVRDGGTQAMRFDVVRVPAEQSLGDYLNSGWMENVDKSSTENLTINGFPAAAVAAHGDQWEFKVYALVEIGWIRNLKPTRGRSYVKHSHIAACLLASALCAGPARWRRNSPEHSRTSRKPARSRLGFRDN